MISTYKEHDLSWAVMLWNIANEFEHQWVLCLEGLLHQQLKTLSLADDLSTACIASQIDCQRHCLRHQLLLLLLLLGRLQQQPHHLTTTDINIQWNWWWRHWWAMLKKSKIKILKMLTSEPSYDQSQTSTQKDRKKTLTMGMQSVSANWDFALSFILRW